MKSIQLFVQLMEQKYGFLLDKSKISIDSTELYQDTIDERLIKHLKLLPYPILLDKLRYEWYNREPYHI
ncbi:hypothetical protein [Bacillus wiedmannii]|uniref:hypothetical protein n=1 Tax=Bacillus wiedmannii TaxID=1890302 RepID=UPI001145428F|nr:hypothetical protein [Bacillus wiedmannii]